MHLCSNNKHQLSHQAWYILLDICQLQFFQKSIYIKKQPIFASKSIYKICMFFYSFGRLRDNIRLLSKYMRKMNELFNIVQELRMQTIHPSILIYQSIYPSIYALIYSSIDLSDHPYYLTIHSLIPFIHAFIHLYIFISTSTHPFNLLNLSSDVIKPMCQNTIK